MTFSKMTILGMGVAAIGLSGCEHAGVQDNFDRSEDFTAMTSSIDWSAPSDLTGIGGTATYNGAALATFRDVSDLIEHPKFTGTADVAMAVDFDNQTIAGTMSDWIDGDPRNYNLRGEVVLFDGTVDPNGTFSTLMSGNLERTAVGADSTETPLLVVIGGGTAGALYDSLDGDRASHLAGEMAGITESSDGTSGTMTGGFVAMQ